MEHYILIHFNKSNWYINVRKGYINVESLLVMDEFHGDVWLLALMWHINRKSKCEYCSPSGAASILEWVTFSGLENYHYATSHVSRYNNFYLSEQNKKSELMLMRRVRAYSSFCSQVILVYLYSLRRNSLFCSRKSQINC